MATLYLIATPIGNLEDISARALRILGEVSLIAAEDTRHTRQLLNHFAIKTPCISYHEHNKLVRTEAILNALAQGDVALVSDAGTPAIADPGAELVAACLNAGFAVCPVPGPSAPIAALVASGLPSERFMFIGFLPRRSSERRALLSELADLTLTIVCFEAPHRLEDALSDILATFGDRRIAVASELTKRFERIWRCRVSEAIALLAEQRPRGEYTLVIEGLMLPSSKRDRLRIRATPADLSDGPSEGEIANRLRELRTEGRSGSSAARLVAREFGLDKGSVYQIWLSLDDE